MATDAQAARELLKQARKLSSTGGYSKAFDQYILAFEKDPRVKESCTAEFRVVLIRLNEILMSAGKIEDIFANFAKAVDAFPSNCFLLNDIGKYLYKFGFYTESWSHFQKALKLNPTFVNAEKNVNSLKNVLFERWHYRMLNDRIRNDAYFSAIEETSIPYKDSVLDIGTGTGILAMFASEFSPTAVTGIEASELMAWIAECVTQGNGMPDIVIVNRMSTTMNYRDIGGKRSLVVTEMFDAGLFGEHVLRTLNHAWEYFTIPTTRFIPNKAEFFVVAARSDSLHKKYQLGVAAKQLLKITDMNVHIISDDEPYDCEDIPFIEDVKYISEPQSLIQVDFNDYRDVQEKLNHTEPYEVKFTANEDNEINLIIGWFNLYLTESITLTTDPRAETRATAWQQAIFYDNVPKIVKKDQVIDAEFLLNGSKLTMLPWSESYITRISPEAIRFLNDEHFMKTIGSCIGMSCIYLGQMADLSHINIVDLCPFPMFGMLMLKRGAQSLTCYAKTENDHAFIRTVLEINKIDLSRINVLEGEEWNHEIFRDEKFHALFCNVIDLSGDIDLRLSEIALQLKTNNLMPGGLVMPANIKLMGQIVNSPWLDVNNRVYDSNTKTYKLAEHINRYEVTQNFCIDFSNLPNTPLTEACYIGPLYSGLRTDLVNFPVTHSGDATAILCWYEIELTEDIGVVSTNRTGSFIDGTLFLINPPVKLEAGKEACLVRTNDEDASFKMAFQIEVPADEN
ncbi:protein arginine N-methyltransferase 9-like isoform X1 [Ostrinia furnacalis]|uniref:protein arginine N-methyltransferase 9-like isoform X1 n=1 Tax=Ostrinia furnacalis TaxID=93504 RepID=UPI0010406BB3|nr:protein arginine N-methyltransferase 9-like isoform X1 [Ostrinia furnacalis]